MADFFGQRAPAEAAELPDAPAGGSGSSVFDVVFVCTGNRFRSPIAEGFFRTFAGAAPVHVSSLGTLHLGARPALPEAVRVASELGLDITAHRSCPIEVGALAGADLVLGFERMHCATAIVEGKADPSRTFTIVEAVELLEAAGAGMASSPVERGRSAVLRADRLRRDNAPCPPAAEFGDPFGRSRHAYRRAGVQLRELSLVLSVRLFGSAEILPRGSGSADPGASVR